MKTERAVTAALIGLMVLVAPASAQDWGCVPTCAPDDGRFLMIAGGGYESLAGHEIELWFGVPAGATSWTLCFFDGDTGGLWDLGSHAPGAFTYTLYADPNGDGTGAVQISQWSSDQLLDNAWFDVTLPVHGEAQQSAGSNFRYRMVVEDTDPDTAALDAFKVRSTFYAAIAPKEFGAIGRLGTLAEAPIIYPNWNPGLPIDPNVQDIATTTFDGTFDFYFSVPAGRCITNLQVWDGDLDFGAFDCSSYDSDDPDTPNDVLPAWADPSTEAVFEGVAMGLVWPGVGCTTSGDPSDDTGNLFQLRSPSVVYELSDSWGSTFANDNPSGNQEWESLSITTSRRTQSDYRVRSIAAGRYKLSVVGLDMDNFMFWRMPYETVCVRADGTPCVPMPPDSCTRTQGYWGQGHKPWPVDSITVGGTTYTRAQAQAWMRNRSRGDKSVNLFEQLVAAKLNVISWTDDSCIAADIAAADAWLATYPVGSRIDASSTEWQQIASSFTNLDQYNNGCLPCASHCW